MPIDQAVAADDYCYLTTTGRVSGLPREIEIWFGLRGETLYLLAGNGRASDWVKNGLRRPDVSVRIRDVTYPARFRLVTDPAEDATARAMLLEKYSPTYSGDLTEWGRTALPVAVEVNGP